MSREDHPLDVWVDVTAFGDAVPRRLLAIDGREVAISRAQDAYVHGRIDVEELERLVAEALA